MRYFAIAFLLINTISAFVLAPKKPSQDDFYTPPQGYEAQPLGSILKTRNVPNPLTNVFTPVKVQNAWQLLVRSEDTFGNPNAIVTTIIQPFNAKRISLFLIKHLKILVNWIVLHHMLFNMDRTFRL